MAELSHPVAFHQELEQEEEEEEENHHRHHSGGSRTPNSIPNWSINAFDFHPLSPPNFSFSSYPNNNFASSYSLANSDSQSEPNCFYGEGDDHHMNFVTDLFADSRDEYEPDDTFLGVRDNDIEFRVPQNRNGGGGGGDFGSNHVDELGFGFGAESDRVAVNPSELRSQYSRILGTEEARVEGGLRVVGLESESDTGEEEELYAYSGGEDDGDADFDFPIFWNCLAFDNGSEEWEEVDSRVEDEREGLSSLIDRIEEISVSSETSSLSEEGEDEEEEVVRNLEWEVLLAVNNMDRNLEFEIDSDADGVSYLAVQDDYVYPADYDAVFGQLVESETALKASPPAAKSFVENLPSVILTEEDVRREDNVVCAVCKDDILVEERVTRLPCRHHYHGNCIVPWLSIRNTCPVCRFQLPTDDEDYEQRKNRRSGMGGLLDNMQVRQF